jgi:hypothetical protein
VKFNIAPRVAVILAVCVAMFSVSIQIATVNQMLKDLKWTLPYLWVVSGALLVLAIWMAFHQNKQERFQGEVTSMVRSLRVLHSAFSKEHPHEDFLLSVKPTGDDDPEVFNEAKRQMQREDGTVNRTSRNAPRNS